MDDANKRAEMIKETLDAANASSTRASGIWLAFLGLLAYLIVALASVTHKDLLLDSAIKLPIVGVDLPLFSFFLFAPVLLILFHFGVLMQHVTLAQKLAAFDKAIQEYVRTRGRKIEAQKEQAQTHPARMQLHGYSITQYTSGPPNSWIVKSGQWLMGWLTLTILPLVILLYFQTQFLPFHKIEVTWLHRGVIFLDLFVLIFVGIFIDSPASSIEEAIKHYLRQYYVRPVLVTLGTVFIVFCSLFVATIPDGGIENFLTKRNILCGVLVPSGRKVFRPTGYLFEPESIRVTCDEESYFTLIEGEPDLTSTEGEPDLTPTEGESDLTPTEGESDLTSTEGESDLTSIEGESDLTSTEDEPDLSLNEDEPNLSSTEEDLDLSLNADEPNSSLTEVETDSSSTEEEPDLSLNADGPDSSSTEDEPAPVEKLFSRNLVITDTDLVSDKDDPTNEVSFSLLGRDLRYALLDRSDLHRVDLTNAKLYKSSMIGTRLEKANLREADLRGADLTGAISRYAEFEEAKLQGANLSRLDLQGSDLRYANLQSANLIEANLQVANIEYANLKGANLSYASLQGAILKNLDLQGVNLFLSSLQGSILSNANLQGVNLSNANLQGASLINANLQGVNLSNANLRGADLSGANLQGADLSYARLQGANLSRAILKGADLFEANIWGSTGVNSTYLLTANLSDLDFEALDDDGVEKLEKEINDLVDDDDVRNLVNSNLERLLAYNKNQNYEGSEGFQEWKKSIDIYNSLAAKDVSASLVNLACEDIYGYIAKGIVLRINRNNDTPPLNTRMLAEALLQEDCQGGKFLDDETRSDLRELANK